MSLAVAFSPIPEILPLVMGEAFFSLVLFRLDRVDEGEGVRGASLGGGRNLKFSGGDVCSATFTMTRACNPCSRSADSTLCPCVKMTL